MKKFKVSWKFITIENARYVKNVLREIIANKVEFEVLELKIATANILNMFYIIFNFYSEFLTNLQKLSKYALKIGISILF